MDKRSVNPFVHRLYFRKRDYIEIFFGTLFLVPIRVILTLLLFMIASLISKISINYLQKWNLPEDEEIKWRNIFKKPIVYVMRAMFFVAGFYKIKVTDKSGGVNDLEAPIKVVAPHTSPFDIMIGVILNGPSPVARHDSVDIPFFGNVINICDPVFVMRDNHVSRQNVITGVLEKIKRNRVIFFPEGTCTNRNILAQFKTGAFRPGLPVQPIALKYDQFGGPDTLSWTWDGPSALVSIWLTFSRLRTGFEMIQLPIYYPTKEEKSDPELYANNVCEVICKELNIPHSLYAFDDVKFTAYNVPRTPVCLKFLKLLQKVISETKNENSLKNGKEFHDNNLYQENGNGLNHRSNGHAKETTKILPNIDAKKKDHQIMEEIIIKTVSESLERITLSSPKSISSQNDLINILGLNHVSNLKQSVSLDQLWQCLRKVSLIPNTIHLAIVLNLCDLREPKLWNRIENCVRILSQNDSKDKNDNLCIGINSLKVLLWFTLAIDNYNDNIKEPITFEYLKHNMVSLFQRAAEENLSHLLNE